MTLVTPIVQSTADVQLAQIRAVALSTFQASSSILYWIGDQNRMKVVDAAVRASAISRTMPAA